jgi:hypothetical protein
MDQLQQYCPVLSHAVRPRLRPRNRVGQRSGKGRTAFGSRSCFRQTKRQQMSHRTVVQSSFEEYFARGAGSPEGRAEEVTERNKRLSRFPYAVMLQVSFPELDFADRWCWRQFGPIDGECYQRYSEYRVCDLDGAHSHSGKWTCHWWEKTDYDFGFNEWYFAERGDWERFLANVGEINWGEKFTE